MTIQKEYAIIRIRLLLLLIGVFSACSLPAQTAADSVLEIGDTLAIDYSLPQYDTPDTTVEAFSEDSLAALYARKALDAEPQYVDTYFQNFNPSPRKAVWMAALFPGGGQIYNRKYWKLPIIYGGFLGLVYGFNWNQRYYKTYQNAYRDLATHSPNASYLQFIRSNSYEAKVKYVEQHESYLLSAFQRKRNFYRNYRDYCIVGMIGVYLVSIVDAYVDAALYHFDVSPELDACNSPAMVVSYKIDF